VHSFKKIRLEAPKVTIKITQNQTPFIEKVNQILTLKNDSKPTPAD
jgi:hypothetical protein